MGTLEGAAILQFTGREQVITKYKGLAAVQGLVGVGLLICGILGTQFTQGDDSFDPPYFIGGYLLGFMNMFSALLATCIVVKGGDKDMNDTKKREVGCAMMGHYIFAMFTIMLTFISLIFAGVYGTSYDSNEYDRDDSADADDAENHKVAYAIIAGCLISLCATIFSMYLICTFGSLFGVQMKQGRRGRIVMSLNTTTIQTNQSASQFNNNVQMEQMRTQNLLLQQQLTLQQQQLLMQQQQQGFSGGQNLPPPPSYNTALSDPTYPPPNPVFPDNSGPPPMGFKQY